MSHQKDYAGLTLLGRRGRRYEIGPALTAGAGGEGRVYSLSGQDGMAAKIYHEDTYAAAPRDRAYIERKICAMLDLGLDARRDGQYCFSWPQDILYHNGRMVGYVMPRIRTDKKIYDVCRESTRRVICPDWTWKHLVTVAYNLSWCVETLHAHGIVVGDLNPNNILVNPDCSVILIDTDSFQITDPHTGECFPCAVGVQEVLAPELQQVGSLASSRARFSRESDCFSLAIHVFNLLMNNYHPFNCRNLNKNVSSVSSIRGNAAILRGDCVYVRPVAGRAKPLGAPAFELLPGALQQLFRDTFDYTELTARQRISARPAAQQWAAALRRTLAQPMAACPADRRHVYPAHNQSCPWCAAARELAQGKPAPVPVPVHSAGSAAPRRAAQPSPAPARAAQKQPAAPASVSAARPGWLNQPLLLVALLSLAGLAAGPATGGLVYSRVFTALGFGPAWLACVLVAAVGVLGGLCAGGLAWDGYAISRRPLLYWLLGAPVFVLAPAATALLAGAVALVIALVIGVLKLLAVCAAILLLLCLLGGG